MKIMQGLLQKIPLLVPDILNFLESNLVKATK